MTIRVFRSWDVGAPQLTANTLNTNLESVFNILDKCLVDGWSGFPSAGWTHAFPAQTSTSMTTGYRVYRASTGNRHFIRLDAPVSFTSGTTLPHFRPSVYSSMSSAADVSNRYSRNQSGGIAAEQYFILKDQTVVAINRTIPWMVVADEKFFHFLVWFGTDWYDKNPSTFKSDNATSVISYMCFGDFISRNANDTYNVSMFSGQVISSASNNVGPSIEYDAYASKLVYGSLSGNFVGGIRSNQSGGDIYVVNDCASSPSSPKTGLPFPDPISGGISLSRLAFIETDYFNTNYKYKRGNIPGRWGSLHIPLDMALSLPYGYNVFQGTNELAGKTFVVIVSHTNSTDRNLIFEISGDWYS